MTKEQIERLKKIKKALKEFPKVVAQKKAAAKKKKKIIRAFEKNKKTILKQIKKSIHPS